MLFVELIQLSKRQTDRQADRQADRQTDRQIKRRDRPTEGNTRSLNIPLASLASNRIDGPADAAPRESHLTASSSYETASFQRLLSPSRFSSHCFSLLVVHYAACRRLEALSRGPAEAGCAAQTMPQERRARLAALGDDLVELRLQAEAAGGEQQR